MGFLNLERRLRALRVLRADGPAAGRRHVHQPLGLGVLGDAAQRPGAAVQPGRVAGPGVRHDDGGLPGATRSTWRAPGWSALFLETVRDPARFRAGAAAGGRARRPGRGAEGRARDGRAADGGGALGRAGRRGRRVRGAVRRVRGAARRDARRDVRHARAAAGGPAGRARRRWPRSTTRAASGRSSSTSPAAARRAVRADLRRRPRGWRACSTRAAAGEPARRVGNRPRRGRDLRRVHARAARRPGHGGAGVRASTSRPRSARERVHREWRARCSRETDEAVRRAVEPRARHRPRRRRARSGRRASRCWREPHRARGVPAPVRATGTSRARPPVGAAAPRRAGRPATGGARGWRTRRRFDEAEASRCSPTTASAVAAARASAGGRGGRRGRPVGWPVVLKTATPGVAAQVRRRRGAAGPDRRRRGAATPTVPAERLGPGVTVAAMAAAGWRCTSAWCATSSSVRWCWSRPEASWSSCCSDRAAGPPAGGRGAAPAG